MEENCPVYHGMFRVEVESRERSVRTVQGPSETEPQCAQDTKEGWAMFIVKNRSI